MATPINYKGMDILDSPNKPGGQALSNNFRELANRIGQSNYTAIIPPTVNDDSSSGYTVGSRWVNTNTNIEYIQIDDTIGSAVWIVSGVATSPAGADTQVQFNNSGSFGASADFTYDSGVLTLNAGTLSPTPGTGELIVAGGVSVGDVLHVAGGYHNTGLPYTNINTSGPTSITVGTILVDTTSGDITITIPDAVADDNGDSLRILKVAGNNNAIVQTASSQNIGGQTTQNVSQLDKGITIVAKSDTSEWLLIQDSRFLEGSTTGEFQVWNDTTESWEGSGSDINWNGTKFNVDGVIEADDYEGLARPIAELNSTQTTTQTSGTIIVDTSGGDVVITIPDPSLSDQGDVLRFIKTGDNVLTVRTENLIPMGGEYTQKVYESDNNKGFTLLNNETRYDVIQSNRFSGNLKIVTNEEEFREAFTVLRRLGGGTIRIAGSTDNDGAIQLTSDFGTSLLPINHSGITVEADRSNNNAIKFNGFQIYATGSILYRNIRFRNGITDADSQDNQRIMTWRFDDDYGPESVSAITDNGSGAIRITTSSTHNYQTGHTVQVLDVTGTLEANGTWEIIRISSTQFDLVDSFFQNAYISGGDLINETFLTPWTIEFNNVLFRDCIGRFSTTTDANQNSLFAADLEGTGLTLIFDRCSMLTSNTTSEDYGISISSENNNQSWFNLRTLDFEMDGQAVTTNGIKVIEGANGVPNSSFWTDGTMFIDSTSTFNFANGENSRVGDATISLLPLSSGITGTDELAFSTGANQLEKRSVTNLFSDMSVVTGSGVANRLAFWNGASTLTSDADLTWDGTTLSVTGGASGTAALQITATVNSAELLQFANNLGNDVVVLNTTATDDSFFGVFNSSGFQGDPLTNAYFSVGTVNDIYLGLALDLKGISKQDVAENTDVDTGTETVDSFATTEGTSCEWLVSISDGTNFRTSKVIAVWDGTNVQHNETATNDIGDTSGVTLDVDINAGDVRLRATVTSDNWDIKVHRIVL